MFTWIFRWLKPPPPPVAVDQTADWPQPMRGDYAVLPAELGDFDWRDWDAAFLTVDGDGLVKLHSWYAHRTGIAWTSQEYTTIGKITSPGANWIHSYWMRPSWYQEMIAEPIAIEEALNVA